MLKITIINAGYGDAILLENSAGTRILLDGGSGLCGEYEGDPFRIRAGEYLGLCGIRRLDALYISHIHEDHVCGLLPVFPDITAGAVISPYPAEVFRNGKMLSPAVGAAGSVTLYTKALNDFSTLVKRADAKGIPFLQAEPGTKTEYPGGLSITVLGPGKEILKPYLADIRAAFSGEDPDALSRLDRMSNATSLILKAEQDGVSVLLPADSVPEHWSGIPAEALRDITVLKLPHHGQKDSVSEQYMKEMQPLYVITTASSDRRYGSASPEVYEQLLAMAEGHRRPVFLFADERTYEPWFSQPDGFSAICIEAENGRITHHFVRRKDL